MDMMTSPWQQPTGPDFWGRASQFLASPQFPIIAGTLGAALSGTDAYGKPTPMAQVGTAAAQWGKGKVAAQTAQNASTTSVPTGNSELDKLRTFDQAVPGMPTKSLVRSIDPQTGKETIKVEHFEPKPWESAVQPQAQPQTQVPTVAQGQPTQAQQLAQQMGSPSQVPFQESLLGRRL